MAQQLYFSRDTKVYLEIGSKVWEVPVLDGFSFSQATNVSEITLAEMESTGGVSRRGRAAFNDSLAPAEWSVTTYVRPTTAGGNVVPVEEGLWELLVGEAGTPGVASYDIDFSSSNKSALPTGAFYFVLGDANKKVYKVTECVVGEASIDFDIDGIAQIAWSGQGAEIVEVAVGTVPAVTETAVQGQLTDTGAFIRNRLTTLTVAPDLAYAGQSGLEANYSITLTGGSISISNNITFITPEELGIVNVALGHVTGTRTISGSLTCYLDLDTGTTTSSSDFWSDVKGLAQNTRNKFSLTFNVGGTGSGPKLSLVMPQCHVDIPTHSVEDVISLETNFNALPSSLDSTDEMTISYSV